jgi:hypothetical protein
VEEPTAAADLNPTSAAPGVINVEKNAAYPKAEAFLKAAGTLPEHVELKPGQIPQSSGGARPPFYQTLGQAWDGFLLL